MDQLKPAIEFCKKHYFWIVISLVSLCSLVGFILTKLSLQSEFTRQKQAIEGSYGSVSAVGSKVSNHPNSASHEKMDAIAKVMAEDVRQAWEMQYNRQVKLMQWPVQELGDDFVSRVEKYRPIESTLEYPLLASKDPLSPPLRERYKLYADRLFPRLGEIIGTKWEVTGADIAGTVAAATDNGGGAGGAASYMARMQGMMGGGSSSSSAAAEAVQGVVAWDKASQKQLMSDVLYWYSGQPTTTQILYTQEDLWILDGFLRIIKATNGDAEENFQAAIKRIEYLRIGRQAAGNAGDIEGVDTSNNIIDMMKQAAASDESGDGEGSAAADSYAAAQEGSGEKTIEAPSAGDAAAEAAAPPEEDVAVDNTDPASGRYVDNNLKVISGSTLREKMQSSDPADAYFAVAKRVPIRLRCVIDQRKLSRFLAECGSADLLFEVKQVRVNTSATAAGAAAKSGGGGNMSMGALFGAGPKNGPAMASGGAGGGSGSAAAAAEMEGGGGAGGMGILGGGGGLVAKTYDLPVEIYGVVYLFNPVNMSKLGLNKVTADAVEGGAEVPADDAQNGDATADPNAPADAAATEDASAEAAPPAADAADGSPAAETPATDAPAADAPAATPAPDAPAGDAAPAADATAPPAETAPTDAAAPATTNP